MKINLHLTPGQYLKLVADKVRHKSEPLCPMFGSIFAGGALEKYIAENTSDPWTRTPFKGYVHMSPKQKGAFGEMFTSAHFNNKGFTVTAAHSSTAGYDRFINGMKVEIKI